VRIQKTVTGQIYWMFHRWW